MLLLFSPSKTQRFSSHPSISNIGSTTPVFYEESLKINRRLAALSRSELKETLKISENQLVSVEKNIANYGNTSYASLSLFAFAGDSYKSLDITSLPLESLHFAQKHLLILSAYYGVLKPFDSISPYRLDLNNKLPDINLYDFWSTKVTSYISKVIKSSDFYNIVNLSSTEYSRLIKKSQLPCNFVDILFLVSKGGQTKNIGIYAKQARGLFARYVIENKIEDIAELEKFNLDGYRIKDVTKNKLTYIKNI